MGAYGYGRPAVGYQALMANVLLTTSNALGYVTELLSGDYQAPFGRSSHHQVWSEAMVILPAIRGLFGLEARDGGRQLRFAPQLPADWGQASVTNFTVGAAHYDLSVERGNGRTTVRLSRPGIVEWQPLWQQPVGALLWLLTLSWVALAVRRARVLRPEAIATVACLAFASLCVLRLLPLFVAVSIVLLLPYVQSLPAGERVWPKERTIVDFAFVCVAVVLLAWPRSVGCIQMQGGEPDIVAARALAVVHPAGRLATSFNWGQYAIWHFGPRARVSIDGRRETVYSDRQLSRQLAMATGETAGLDELARTLPEYVWLPTSHAERTRQWLTSHAYRIDVQTPESFVAVRHDLPKLQAMPGPSAACFPGL